MTGLKPSTSSLGVLVLVTLTCFAGGTAAQEAAAPLKGAAAWQQIVGNTAVANTKSGAYTEFYGPDGTIRRLDADGRTEGHWALQGDQVCLDYPEDDEKTCVAVTLAGSAGTFTDADGARDMFDVLPGNAKGL